MRLASCAALCLALVARSAFSSGTPFRLHNAGKRTVVVVPQTRVGKTAHPAGSPFRLFPRQGIVVSPFSAPKADGKTVYELCLFNERRMDLGKVSVDGRVLKSAAKRGVEVLVEDRSVLVHAGSRRLRVILPPEIRRGSFKKH